MILKDYIAVDLEMTGLNAKRDRILEIGAVRIRDKKIDGKFQSLVRQHEAIPQEVETLTGITNEMAESGRELDEVFSEWMDFCSEDAVLLGHNLIFDYSFLKQAALNRQVSFERKGIDTLKIARKLLPGAEKKNLHALCGHYHIIRGQEHRALDDALATQALYEIFEQEYEAENPQVFEPYPLIYKAKKQVPATARQKNHLKELAEYHKIALNVPWETLTKNEASRQIDRIIAAYGRMPK